MKHVEHGSCYFELCKHGTKGYKVDRAPMMSTKLKAETTNCAQVLAMEDRLEDKLTS